MSMTRQLGPVVGATLVTNDIQRVQSAYVNTLGFTVQESNVVSQQCANFWQAPALKGAPYIILTAANGDSWLRVIEDKIVITPTPLKHYGWMSLEVNVGNVDNIRCDISDQDENFTILGEPAYLELSDAIKACQIAGPAGEVTYLTEIQAPVPPFELPMTSEKTGSLFIPVLCTPNRQETLDFYQQLNENTGLCFDTKITVLNKYWNYDIHHQYPVATIQLDGECLFEIDEVNEASVLKIESEHLPAGIAMISCAVKDIDLALSKFTALSIIQHSDYRDGVKCALLKGKAGELIELVELAKF